MKYLNLILIFTCLFVFNVQAQHVFLGGTPGPMIPFGNYENHSYIDYFSGGHTGQTKEVVTSSDGNILYFETADVFSQKYRIEKYDIANSVYLSDIQLQSAARDLELSDDNNYLFFHSIFKLYKLNLNTMLLEDSIALSNTISHIEVYDNNTVYCNKLNKTFKASFITHELEETLSNTNGNLELVFNSDKSKLYSIDDAPASLLVFNIDPMSVDTVVMISNSTGTYCDIKVDDTYIYIYAAGIGNGGNVVIMNLDDYSIANIITTPDGYGGIEFAPNGKLWVTAGASSSISIIDIATTSLDTTFNTTTWNNIVGPYKVAFSENSIPLSLKELSNTSFEIFPNPTKSSLTIRTQTMEPVHLCIHSVNGKLVYEKTFAGMETKLNIENFPEGIYTISLSTPNGTMRRNFVKI